MLQGRERLLTKSARAHSESKDAIDRFHVLVRRLQEGYAGLIHPGPVAEPIDDGQSRLPVCLLISQTGMSARLCVNCLLG